MRTKFFHIAIALAICTSYAVAQDTGEAMLKKALEGRQVLVKMDLPAVDLGIPMTFDNTNVSFDQSNYNKLIKDYGVGVTKDTKAKITAVRVSSKGIELDLNGGGLPEHDWMVNGMKVAPPIPTEKSEREADLERMIANEPNSNQVNYWKTELEAERNSRFAQDLRNQESYQRVVSLRSDYIEKNRGTWGSKLVVFVRTRSSNVTMKDMAKSLAKYVELLPRDTQGQ